VRTSRPGYLRDPRRLTVALSRARLGLYVLGRRALVEACPELARALAALLERPDRLRLVVGETFPTTRAADGDELKRQASGGGEQAVEEADMDGVEHLGRYVYEMTQAKMAALRAGAEALPGGGADGVAAGMEEQDVDDVHAGGELRDVEGEDAGVDRT